MSALHLFAKGHAHAAIEDFGWLEWTVTGLAGVVSAWCVWKAVQYSFRPGETEPDHVKRIVLGPQDGESGVARVVVEAAIAERSEAHGS